MITRLPVCVMCGAAEPHLDEEGDPVMCPDFRVLNGAGIKAPAMPYYFHPIPDTSARWLCD